MKAIGCILIAATALAACGRLPSIPVPFRQNTDGGTAKVEFDGLRFRARARAVTPDRRGFQVTVGRAARSAEGAAEAGRHRAIAYCLNTAGGSDIQWAFGPDEAAAAPPVPVLTLTGTCTTR